MCKKSTCFLRYSLLGPLNLHRKNHFSNIGGVKTYQDPPCSNIGGVLTPWTPLVTPLIQCLDYKSSYGITDSLLWIVQFSRRRVSQLIIGIDKYYILG